MSFVGNVEIAHRMTDSACRTAELGKSVQNQHDTVDERGLKSFSIADAYVHAYLSRANGPHAGSSLWGDRQRTVKSLVNWAQQRGRNEISKTKWQGSPKLPC